MAVCFFYRILSTVIPLDLKIFPLTVKCHDCPWKSLTKAALSVSSASPISGAIYMNHHFILCSFTVMNIVQGVPKKIGISEFENIKSTNIIQKLHVRVVFEKDCDLLIPEIP